MITKTYVFGATLRQVVLYIISLVPYNLFSLDFQRFRIEKRRTEPKQPERTSCTNNAIRTMNDNLMLNSVSEI